MSDLDDAALSELEQQLDEAFATARPRPGYREELWSRLKRPRWWQRLTVPAIALPAAGALAAVLVVGLVLAVLVPQAGHLGGGGASSSGASSSGASGTSGTNGGATSGAMGPAPASRQAAAPAATIDGFGPLPRPAPTIGAPTPQAAGPAKSIPVVVSTSLPVVPGLLPVYRYTVASGIQTGTILDPAAVPGGLASSDYPTNPPSQAVQEAAAALPRSGRPARQLTVTRAQLVYVAVASGDVGYLEPAYQFTATVQTDGGGAPVSVLVPAVASSALR